MAKENKMRKIYIAGNWKMNKTSAETTTFLNELVQFNQNWQSDQVVQIICPPFLYLESAKKTVLNSNIFIGAQNCSDQNNGAYTGEISVLMLKDIQMDYCIIGHSERRQFYGETDTLIQKKYLKLKESNIKAIICIGETLSEREANRTFDIIDTQLSGIFKEIHLEETESLLIAYEPVWAIGTGKTATPEQAQEVHQYIRNWFNDRYNKEIAENIAILYGGSVKPDNIKELLACADIDGGLIGGAALDIESYKKMLMTAGE